MKHYLLFTFFVLSVFLSFLKAQNKGEVLVTDRPDQTESSSVVPHHSLQIETGFVIENNKTDLTKQKSYAYNTTLLRYGLLDNFELRCGLEYLSDNTEIKNTNINYSTSGFSPIYVGFKVKIENEDIWKPEIAFLGGLVLPFTAGDNYKPEYSGANIRFAFSHTLSDNFSLGYNLGVEWDGHSAVPCYFYSLATGYGLSENMSIFLESYGLIPEEGDSEHLLDAGFTYLLLPNFQFDISGGVGLNNEAINNFVSMGLTYRFPH